MIEQAPRCSDGARGWAGSYSERLGPDYVEIRRPDRPMAQVHALKTMRKRPECTEAVARGGGI